MTISGSSTRWLHDQLQRLRATVEALLGRLREDLALTIARTVGEAVRQAVRDLAGGPPDEPMPAPYRTSTRAEDDHPWGRSSPSWVEDETGPSSFWEDEELETVPPPEEIRPSVPGSAAGPWSHWGQAVSAGVRAAAWWVGRSSRHPVLGASTVAVIAALGTAFVGPGVVAGAVGACLGVFGVVDAVAAATRALRR